MTVASHITKLKYLPESDRSAVILKCNWIKACLYFPGIPATGSKKTGFYHLTFYLLMIMITFWFISPEDLTIIKRWPPYPLEFQELDYALRDDGWLDEYCKKPGAKVLVADDDGEIVGFSIIAREPGGRAEFRIALHPKRVGLGIGSAIARHTLAHGFSDPATGTIRLIVRKNNPRAEHLYERLDFCHTGECRETIQGKPVEFYRMEIDRDTFHGVKRR